MEKQHLFGALNASQNQTSVVAHLAPETNNTIIIGRPPRFNERSEYRALDQTGRDRFDNLSNRYSDDNTFQILAGISTYGINTYNNVSIKVDFITDNKHDNAYYHAILNEVKIGALYYTVDINRFISGLRKSLGMQPYLTNMAKSSTRDFLQLFMAEVTLSDWNDTKTDKPFAIGYTPIFDLTNQL